MLTHKSYPQNTWGVVQTLALQWPQPLAVSAAPCCAGDGRGLQPGQPHTAGQPVCTQPRTHTAPIQHLKPEGSDPSPAGWCGRELSQWRGCREEGEDAWVVQDLVAPQTTTTPQLPWRESDLASSKQNPPPPRPLAKLRPLLSCKPPFLTPPSQPRGPGGCNLDSATQERRSHQRGPRAGSSGPAPAAPAHPGKSLQSSSQTYSGGRD